MTDCRREFPRSWFKHAKLAKGKRDCGLNFFGIDAGQPLSEWKRKGWIHPDDPRGWFQWYCRYYRGRRMEKEDKRQIGRWKAIRRHVRQLQKNCEPGDLLCRRRQRQALLHWAYDSRKIERYPRAISSIISISTSGQVICGLWLESISYVFQPSLLPRS